MGKSSLLNRLFNRKSLARVSSVPGKTVTVNFYDVDGVHCVELPGYGYAKISKAEKKRFEMCIRDRQYGVQKCYYGHLHGAAARFAFEGEYQGCLLYTSRCV